MDSQWMVQFKSRHNRAPKVLHIGNIANNAYQNAKMLNAAGYDCDVLCYDYYHIAGNPEWDDADFEGEIENQFYPDWSAVDLKGFERPIWFVQGRFSLCLKYLKAKRAGDVARAARIWRRLSLQRWFLAKNHTVTKSFSFIFGKIAQGIWWLGWLFRTLFYLIRDAINYVFAVIGNIFTDWAGFWHKVKLLCKGELWTEKTVEQNPVIQYISQELSRLFPERKANLTSLTLSYHRMAQQCAPVFAEYDIIIGYADTPILPYLAEVKNYIAFEHGTIRDLPYEDNDRGNLMLLSYACAKAVYVTNIDCVESAEYITKNTGTPIVCGLHGIDISRITHKIQMAVEAGGEDINEHRFSVPPEETLFFCPSRHDIDTQRGVFLKGDEKLVRAAARLAEESNKFRLVLVNFGQDTHRLKTMIEGYPNLVPRVIWCDPLGKSRLYQAYRYADGVLDQFLLPAFGAITVETLCAGGGVLISQKVPDEDMVRFFGKQLPTYKCEEEQDIYLAMSEVMQHPSNARQKALEGVQWIHTYHSNQKIVSLLEQAFAACV